MEKQLSFLFIGTQTKGLNPKSPDHWSFTLSHVEDVDEAIAHMQLRMPDVIVLEEQAEADKRKIEKVLEQFRKQAYLISFNHSKPLAFTNQLDLLLSRLDGSNSISHWDLTEW